MRQRAWPDMIVTAEGMRHALENVPERAELLMLAWDDGAEVIGWCTAGREWWVADPDRGTLVVAVDPSRRGEGIGSALAEAADAHLTAIGVTTTRGGSVDEPGARALATRLGFSEIATAATSAVDPRTVSPEPVPEGIRIVPFAELDDAASALRPRRGGVERHPERGVRRHLVRGVAGRVLALAVDRPGREPGGIRRRRARRPDDDPDRRAERPRPEQRHRHAASVPWPWPGAPAEDPQPPSRGAARRDDRDHGQRRDERADARGQHAARLPAVLAAARVGARRPAG